MKVYFKNLDGLRFIAALIVLLHHAFYFKRHYSPGLPFLNHIFEDAGRIGVNLFFVLSGFLISYLLIVEKDKTGRVNFKNFYIRRILRIWPLYLGYGIILSVVGPFVTSYLGTETGISVSQVLINLFFLLIFSVNFQLAFTTEHKGVFQISWSVCIEEQFYLFWPLVVNYFRKRLVRVFIVLFLLRTIIRILIYILPQYYDISYERLVEINYLLIFDKLDLFGGGMLAALIFMNRDNYRNAYKMAFSPIVQVVLFSLTVLYSLAVIRPSKDIFFFCDHIISVILFGYTILALISEYSILNFEQPLIKYLGKVSFGIYLFHTSVCQLVFIFFRKFIAMPDSLLVYDFFYPLCCLGLTALISYISYEYYESVFLKMKNKFSVVSTRI